MREIPDDVHEAYPSAILIGISDSVGTAEAKARGAATAPRSLRWIGGLPPAWADADIPNDVLEMVRWYASEDTDPDEDS
ncbi:hypothetical protein AB0M35_27860 [Micromonospora sp. NPDC051196]|uniref:hypothetical protein n=1 Tax=Micromonospora sp. NPDC051196 TaxID=3155281 RepID=UPI00341EC176